jgi:hypothetical protein
VLQVIEYSLNRQKQSMLKSFFCFSSHLVR